MSDPDERWQRESDDLEAGETRAWNRDQGQPDDWQVEQDRYERWLFRNG